MSEIPKSCIDDLMNFFRFSYTSETYKGTVVFRIQMQDGTEELRSVRVKPNERVSVYQGFPSDGNVSCECTLNLETFYKLYMNTIDAKKAVLTGKVKVRYFKFHELNGFMSSFDFSTERWDKYYVFKKEQEQIRYKNQQILQHAFNVRGNVGGVDDGSMAITLNNIMSDSWFDQFFTRIGFPVDWNVVDQVSIPELPFTEVPLLKSLLALRHADSVLMYRALWEVMHADIDPNNTNNNNNSHANVPTPSNASVHMSAHVPARLEMPLFADPSVFDMAALSTLWTDTTLNTQHHNTSKTQADLESLQTLSMIISNTNHNAQRFEANLRALAAMVKDVDRWCQVKQEQDAYADDGSVAVSVPACKPCAERRGGVDAGTMMCSLMPTITAAPSICAPFSPPSSALLLSATMKSLLQSAPCVEAGQAHGLDQLIDTLKHNHDDSHCNADECISTVATAVEIVRLNREQGLDVSPLVIQTALAHTLANGMYVKGDLDSMLTPQPTTDSGVWEYVTSLADWSPTELLSGYVTGANTNTNTNPEGEVEGGGWWGTVMGVVTAVTDRVQTLTSATKDNTNANDIDNANAISDVSVNVVEHVSGPEPVAVTSVESEEPLDLTQPTPSTSSFPPLPVTTPYSESELEHARHSKLRQLVKEDVVELKRRAVERMREWVKSHDKPRGSKPTSTPTSTPTPTPTPTSISTPTPTSSDACVMRTATVSASMSSPLSPVLVTRFKSRLMTKVWANPIARDVMRAFGRHMADSQSAIDMI